ncbi:hypothetical protein B9Z55_004705 [Caenorhabditis nigoni]|uniref:Uncharacterized protein n=1 Tax=Caenorhabditis nigoni TaxID=1611254 RepID=A0A2G5UXM7_9PELO|nr:hypothetical protein B9Z55_004705 [Caenorhabditis nigoni]
MPPSLTQPPKPEANPAHADCDCEGQPATDAPAEAILPENADSYLECTTQLPADAYKNPFQPRIIRNGIDLTETTNHPDETRSQNRISGISDD